MLLLNKIYCIHKYMYCNIINHVSLWAGSRLPNYYADFVKFDPRGKLLRPRAKIGRREFPTVTIRKTGRVKNSSSS
jgi:hypothetical protein